MAAREAAHIRWLNMAALIAFAWAAMLLELAPISGEALALPAPDLLFCVTAFLALRRPASTPVALILVLALIRDLVSGAPVGLGALALLAAVETLRAFRPRLRRALVFEFLGVAAAAAFMLALQVAALVVTFADPPPLDQLGLRLAATSAAYVAVHILFRWAFSVADEDAPRRIMRGQE